MRLKTKDRAPERAAPSGRLEKALLAFADLESDDLLLMGEAMHETAIRAGQLPASDSRWPGASGLDLNAAMFSNLESLGRIQEKLRAELQDPNSPLNRLPDDADEKQPESPAMKRALRRAHLKAAVQQSGGRWMFGVAVMLLVLNLAVTLWGPQRGSGDVWAAEKSRQDGEIQELRDQIEALRSDADFRAEMFSKAIERLSQPQLNND